MASGEVIQSIVQHPVAVSFILIFFFDGVATVVKAFRKKYGPTNGK